MMIAVEIRICKKCGEEKSLIEAFRGKTKKNGRTYYSHTCKKCTVINEASRKSQWYYDNHEELTKRNQQYYIDNKEHLLEVGRQYYLDNKETITIANAKYAKEHPEVRKKCQENYRNSKKLEPSFRLRSSISRSIRHALNGTKGRKSAWKYLPYTVEMLKTHIESLFSHPSSLTPDKAVWMTWDNWGPYHAKTWNDIDPSTWTWQLDHIIPHSLFKYETMDCQEFRDCWDLTNLRPYKAKLNIIDGASKIRHKEAA